MKLCFIAFISLFIVLAAGSSKICSKNKTTSNPSTKSKCRRINKREGGYDRGGTMCANKPFSDRIWSGVKWDHTEPEITLIPPSAYTTMGQFGYVYPHRTPKCVSIKDGHFVYRLARAPGVKCQKLKGEATAPYSGNFTFRPTKQMICNDTGYFVYADIIDTGGCPIADVLYDCQHPADQPVKIAGEEVAVVTPHTLSAYKDARDSCKGDFLGLAVQIFDAKYPLPSSPHRILFKTKSSVPGRFTLDEVETSVCQEAPPTKSVCAPTLGEPLFKRPWKGVSWAYTDANLAGTPKDVDGLTENLVKYKLDSSPTVSIWADPRCYYMNATRVEYRAARVPGLYCKQTFERYAAKFKKQVICGNEAYFIYIQVDNSSGCPVTDLLADCTFPDQQPVKVAGEPVAVAAPRATWAFADSREPCVTAFFGLVLQIYEAHDGKRSLLLKVPSVFGLVTTAEIESIICPEAPPSISACGPSSKTSLYESVNWSYMESDVPQDRRLKSKDYETAKAEFRFYYQYVDQQIPYCSNGDAELVGLNTASSHLGYMLDESCITYKANVNIGLDGWWHKQLVCNSRGYFNYFAKLSFSGYTEPCRLSELLQYCQTASANGKNFTALVPTEHAVYKDNKDSCPDDFFGLVVEIYEFKENPADDFVPKSVLYTSRSYSGRLNLDEIEAAVCSTRMEPETSAAPTVTVRPPCTANNNICTTYNECCDYPKFACRSSSARDTRKCISGVNPRPFGPG